MIFSYNEILDLLNGKDDKWLFAEANRLKEEVYGDEVFFRGIIETGNECTRSCEYCGIRKEMKRPRYLLTSEQILSAVNKVKSHNLGSIVLQAGEINTQAYYDYIANAVKLVRDNYDGDIVLSHGNMPKEQYERFKELGASRYLIKVETLQKELYEKLHPGEVIEDRIGKVKELIELGYQVGSGFIAGLPGYTNEMLAEDLLELRKLNVHMFSISPFVPTPGTPLENNPRGSIDLIYRATAIYRILDPKVNIPVTTALTTLDEYAIEKGLKLGANVVMASFTPEEEKKQYEIYKGKIDGGVVENLKRKIEAVGLHTVENEWGRSRKETSAN